MYKAIRYLRAVFALMSLKECDHGDRPCGPEHHNDGGGGFCANCYLCN